MPNASPYMIEFGYEPITTFWSDFTIADRFIKIDPTSIIDTFKRGMIYAKTDYKYYTEFVMVLNHKMWQHHELGRNELSRQYQKLWEKADGDFLKIFGKDKKASDYYYSTLD